VIVRVSDDAERDLADGIAFYDQHGHQIGDHFLNSVLGDLGALSVLGGVHVKRYGYHWMAAKRFPFAIYYTLDGDKVFVIAVLDERRDPHWIQERLNRG
jgi:plasmid stabilization system protein ParE